MPALSSCNATHACTPWGHARRKRAWCRRNSVGQPHTGPAMAAALVWLLLLPLSQSHGLLLAEMQAPCQASAPRPRRRRAGARAHRCSALPWLPLRPPQPPAAAPQAAIRHATVQPTRSQHAQKCCAIADAARRHARIITPLSLCRASIVLCKSISPALLEGSTSAQAAASNTRGA